MLYYLCLKAMVISILLIFINSNLDLLRKYVINIIINCIFVNHLLLTYFLSTPYIIQKNDFLIIINKINVHKVRQDLSCLVYKNTIKILNQK